MAVNQKLVLFHVKAILRYMYMPECACVYYHDYSDINASRTCNSRYMYMIMNSKLRPRRDQTRTKKTLPKKKGYGFALF